MSVALLALGITVVWVAVGVLLAAWDESHRELFEPGMVIMLWPIIVPVGALVLLLMWLGTVAERLGRRWSA